MKAKEADLEEHKNIKQQVDMYEAAKQAIEEQRRKVSWIISHISWKMLFGKGKDFFQLQNFI